MATIRRYVPRSPSQLLSHILEREELVAAIRDLPSAELCRLIDRIGVEDAGDLIALATTEQLAALLDEDLWRADESGFEARFDPQRFVLWLQVMGESGDELLTRRLCELPVDLLTLAVNRLVLVIDTDALRSYYSGARDELGQIERALENTVAEEWEEFCLIARDLDGWEDVWNALLLLDREHHTRLRTLLEQCCAMSLEYIDGQGGLYEVLTSDEMLESDALASRDDRRASQGYVSSSDARAFLELARDERQPLARRDPITTSYFRALDMSARDGQASSLASPLASSGASKGVRALMQLVAEHDVDRAAESASGRLLSSGGEAVHSPSSARNTPHKTGAAERLQTTSQARPGGRSSARHTDGSGRPSRPAARGKRTASMTRAPTGIASEAREREQLPLLSALAVLARTEPAVHAARMQELAYLGNVLIAGCKHQGCKLRPAEALEAAIASSNLGLELWHSPTAKSASPLAPEHALELVRSIDGDRMFRLAWSALQRELVQPAGEALAARCALLDARRARQAHKLLQERNPHALLRLCAASDLQLDEATLGRLVAWAEPLPCQPPRRTQPDAHESSRWFSSRVELEAARTLLGAAGLRS